MHMHVYIIQMNIYTDKYTMASFYGLFFYWAKLDDTNSEQPVQVHATPHLLELYHV